MYFVLHQHELQQSVSYCVNTTYITDYCSKNISCQLISTTHFVSFFTNLSIVKSRKVGPYWFFEDCPVLIQNGAIPKGKEWLRV